MFKDRDRSRLDCPVSDVECSHSAAGFGREPLSGKVSVCLSWLRTFIVNIGFCQMVLLYLLENQVFCLWKCYISLWKWQSDLKSLEWFLEFKTSKFQVTGFYQLEFCVCMFKVYGSWIAFLVSLSGFGVWLFLASEYKLKEIPCSWGLSRDGL